jgi:hypothetical protein
MAKTKARKKKPRSEIVDLTGHFMDAGMIKLDLVAEDKKEITLKEREAVAHFLEWVAKRAREEFELRINCGMLFKGLILVDPEYDY